MRKLLGNHICFLFAKDLIQCEVIVMRLFSMNESCVGML